MAVATGTSMCAKYILPYIPGLKTIRSSAYREQLSPKAKRKLEVYELYQTEKLTMQELSDVFKVNKSTISRWIKEVQKALDINRYNLLEPKSRAPQNRPREKALSWEDKKLILEVRKKKRCGKDNISRYILREYGRWISPSTIHRFLTTLSLYKDPMYIFRTKKKVKSDRKKRPVKRLKDVICKLEQRAYERFQVDTKYWTVNGHRFYIIAGIDVITRMGFARAYSRHTSGCAADFLNRMSAVFEIEKSKAYVQKDNGSEFMGEFEKEAKKYGIGMITNYPRQPKANAYIERFHRTYKEQLLIYELPETVEELNKLLYDYLIGYNFERLHSGVGNITPFEKYCELKFKKPIDVLKTAHNGLLHMLWTSTSP